MTKMLQKRAKAIVDQIIALIKEKAPSRESRLLIKFTRYYFANVSYEDLRERELEDLYGALMFHWQLISHRASRESKVCVYNPNRTQHGWQSTHTIIQVAHDDMPFLVDSIRMAINRRGLLIHFVIHPGGIKVQRNNNSQLIDILPPQTPNENLLTEAPVYLEIDRQMDQSSLDDIKRQLIAILADVTVVVEDWPVMRQRIYQALLNLERSSLPIIDVADIAESKDFLRWLESGNFVFLGCRDYQFIEKGSHKLLKAVQGTDLGLLRKEKASLLWHLSDLPLKAQRLILSPQILTFSKMMTRSTVHRSAYTDCIDIKQFDSKGHLIGKRRIIGLYTANAYSSQPKEIPFLRHKVAKVLQNSGLDALSHAGKTLLNILEMLPRDDLFHATLEQLLEFAMGILQLQDRQRIRLFMRQDSYGQFFSCLVFVPRYKFNVDLCEKMKTVLQKALDAKEVAFEPLFLSSALTCLHFVLNVDDHRQRDVDEKAIEDKLIMVGCSWQDKLRSHLISHYGEAQGLVYFYRYHLVFPASYREDVEPEVAVNDICHIESLNATKTLSMNLYRPSDGSDYLRFKAFQHDYTIPLSDALPILENMGLRVIGERPHRLLFSNGMKVWINDFDMFYVDGSKLEIAKIKTSFQEAFAAIWHKQAESDQFNRLILGAKLSWREVAMLRAYAKYFRQIGATFSETYIAQTLIINSDIACCLVKLFKEKFDPYHKPNTKHIEKDIITRLENVTRLDQDRILQQYLELIKATLRTNYFQKDESDHYKPYLSFKFDPKLIANMPLPRPMYEIYVYSPRFEAVHLRGAKVARGGLRWSDRSEDFRMEILGLMKAQQVKNACIVPSGAKGGFITKCIDNNASRDEIIAEGISCYRNFIQALLDISDNVSNKTVIHPARTAIYDGNDPYLVVAADKGTATFSDIANEVSASCGFWLGDAFASGGSFGYDHKKMGITARGAWESVKRHFRQLGRNIQTNDFTTIGIGDMSGDVFGNGVLLSPHTKLVAAFNHMHIFIDPCPDVKKSFKERRRLFNLGRCTWADYNPKYISTGGGVFSRFVKAIKLSPEIKKLLDLKQDYIIPNELIKAMLTMKVDLLWNGGIGTFVKALSEVDSDVGDRANDTIRVNANQLRCQVVGEGGNLGFTQLARVEYELNGGRIYTDFIDNSAGVNCSDHEVNIKILLNDVISKGALTSEKRNSLLEKMTDEVATLVLQDNYHQIQAISLAASKAADNFDLYARYMHELVAQGKLDLRLEFLPNKKLLIERKAMAKGLTCPELAVLFAYSKNILKEKILASNVPEDPYLSRILTQEFPTLLRNNYEKQMKNHILRREIIAMRVSNTLINEMGFTFIPRLHEETSATVAEIVRAFTIAQKIFGKYSIWYAIEQLDFKVEAMVQFAMMRKTNRLIRRATRWLLRNRRGCLEINKMVAYFAKPIAMLANKLPMWLPEAEKQHYDNIVAKLTSQHVPEKVAIRIAACLPLFSALDIVEATLEHKWQLARVAKIYYALGVHLELNWFRRQVSDFKPKNRWQALLKTLLRDDLDWWQRMLTVHILQHSKHHQHEKTSDQIERWLKKHQAKLSRWYELAENIKASTSIDAIMLLIAVRELEDLVQMKLYN